MDYVEQITAFNWYTRCIETVSDKAQLIYFKLMDQAYHSGWEEWFQFSSLALMGVSGINSKNTLHKKRKELIDLGLIEFKRGQRGKRSQYRIIPFVKEKDGPYELRKTA